ncbi:MAG: NADH-quinone oxidoreductase subunit L, partial [Deltaproteobacteria bacterium]|nr:NADH-quinone oxidoreductase subunit L [Deltaproteobacteria bacterium]
MENPTSTGYLFWIPLLPLIGAAINGLLGAKLQKNFGKGIIGAIACTPVSLSFFISLWVFVSLLTSAPEERFLLNQVYSWISLGSLNVDVAFWV